MLTQDKFENMKKTLIKNILGLMVILSTTACTKQLDLNPYDRIAQTQAFNTINDAIAWDNGFYSSLRGNVYGVFTISQDVQADQLNASLDYGNRNGNPHRWGQSFNSDDGVLSGTWAGYYGALKNINLFLQNYSNIKITASADQTKLNQYVGDAYLMRAYYYSELIIRFAKPFETATAATDPGVPLLLAYNPTELPARATVKAVYDQILADITQAKAALTGVTGSQSATKFTLDVATALEARVRLNMHDWSGAMTAANTVIASNRYPLINNATALTAMWTNDVSTETIFQVFLSKPNELGNTNNIYLGFNSSNNTYDPDFIPTQTILDLYDAADIRKAVYFATKPCVISAVSYPTLKLVNKFPGNPSLWTTAATNYENAPKLFRVAELYLIYAEAAANLGGSNEALALTALNTLRAARGVSTLSGLTGSTLVQAVRDERTRELAFEGFRLWDLKRWHLGFTRGTPQNLSPIQQGAAYNLINIAADNYQFVWGIPTNDITLNANLTQNPGGW